MTIAQVQMELALKYVVTYIQ